jgi:beta-N-acetylhexosaminidase
VAKPVSKALSAIAVFATVVAVAPHRSSSPEPAAATRLACTPAGEPGGSRPARRSVVAGRSVRGRRIVALGRACGKPRAVLLVIGSIHGNETGGHSIIRMLRALQPPPGVELWTVRSVNPDGVANGMRQNANGVDLNRNFPYRWRPQGRPFGTYYAGPRPLSEPESRAVRRLVQRVRPTVTIWYHQALRLVDLGSGANPKLVRAYARRSGLPAGHVGFLPGVATRWQNHRFPGTSAFVVELPAGTPATAAARRHAAAALAVARLAREASSSAVTSPGIVQWRIPFGPQRKRQMRAYARRHYGINDYRLRNPRVIVLHLSVTDSAKSVYETFAPNRPDPELGELPGVCAHFAVDPRGRIYQFVSLRLMCRHTVGLNYVSIGVEHVGRREADVFGDESQLRASLRLVRWLQERFGIRTRNVIGHNESLRSPYHRERVKRLRRQTHGDFPTPYARRYRRLLP